MDDATLARLEHENMLDWLRVSAGRAPGGLVREAGGVGTYATEIPKPLFNQVVTTFEPTERGFEAAVATMRDRGRPFCACIDRAHGDRFAGAVERLGIELDPGILPGFALHPIPPDPPAAIHGFEIRQVADREALEHHIRVLCAVFGVPEWMGWAWVGEEVWRVPGCITYVGYAGDEPVATGFSVRTGRTLGVYSIATMPAARGRGYGAAMTARLAADGAAAGCDVATLQASSMGRPIYERLGYRLVVEYDVFVDPTTLE